MVLERTVKERDTYQARIAHFTAENEEYRRRVVQLTDQVHIVEQYEAKLTKLSVEINRLNDVINVRIE
jgi:hypothetical protein